MKIQSLVRKRLLIFCTTLFIVVVLTISSTFALKNNDITKTEIQENTNKLVLKYLNDGNSIKTGEYPMNKETGLSKAPVNKIQIHNKDNKASDFSLKLYPTDISDKSITTSKVYYSVNEGEPRILGDSIDSVIYRGTLDAGKKETVTVQIWLDSDRVENDDQDKVLDLQFKVFNY